MVATLIVGFVSGGSPAKAMTWVDAVIDAPEHVAELRNKIARLYPGAAQHRSGR